MYYLSGDVSIKLWDINLDKQEYKNKLIIFESWDYLTLFTLNQHNNQIYFCNKANNIKIFNLYKGINDSLNYKEEFTIKSSPSTISNDNGIIALFQPINSEQLLSFGIYIKEQHVMKLMTFHAQDNTRFTS